MVISALKAIGKPKLADAVTQVSQHKSLYKQCEEDSQRWEVIFKKALKMGERKGEKEL